MGAHVPIVDADALRAALNVAARVEQARPASQRQAALVILRQALEAGRSKALTLLDGRGGGLAAARALSTATDAMVGALYDFTVSHVIRASNPTEGERLALMAVGGYGRELLAPYSDIDLLFLRAYKPTPHVENVVEFMLYALWDLDLKVGHAVRTVDDSLVQAGRDSTIATALLDARRLAGDRRLAADLTRRFRQEVVKGANAAFVAAKLRERDARHAKAGASRYLVEPNIKEGKGGLRDLDTLFWIARHFDPGVEAGAVTLKTFDRRERAILARAADFLWTARFRLHDLKGRAEERLTFDVQADMARRMGYLAATDGEAVERFMRRYFMVAKEVGALTRAFCAGLEAEDAKPRPAGLSRFWPAPRAPRRKLAAQGFHEIGGRLNIDGPHVFRRDPVSILRLFSLADGLDLDLHPVAVTAVHRAHGLITPALRRDPEAVEAFFDVLARGKRAFESLTRMNETGVLGRFVPEFGRVVGQMQFNMYHAYTVDEHTLRGIGVLAEIAAGRLDEDHPLAVSIFPMIADREALFLAMLLHDTGKGGKTAQEIGGERAARAACQRLGLAPDRTELVAWLVRHHLVMSETAQKRDLRDAKTIEAFARTVETPERLRMLTVITGADIRSVGPGVWNGWKGQLLRDLYRATELWLRGTWAADAASRRAGLAESRGEAAARFAAEMDDVYLASAADDLVAVHAVLVRQAEREGAAASARLRGEHNALEVSVAARDRHGLFAALAGSLAAAGAQVTGASLHTSRQGMAIDVFFVQDQSGEPFGKNDRGRIDRLLANLEAAALDQAPARVFRALHAPPGRRASSFPIAPAVSVDNEASDESTVIEASGRDRPGLLAALAASLSGAGLAIQSAHVASYGERASDVFYVRDEAGGKLKETAADAVRTELLAVLGAPSLLQGGQHDAARRGPAG